jgi:hypothetical protein
MFCKQTAKAADKTGTGVSSAGTCLQFREPAQPIADTARGTQPSDTEAVADNIKKGKLSLCFNN